MGSIEEAIADLESQERPNFSATAEKYGIHRTTLSRRYRGVTSSRKDFAEETSLLSKQQSKDLANYVDKLTAHGIPHSPAIIRVFAFNLSGIWPGNGWVYRWLKARKETHKSGYLSGADLSCWYGRF